MNKLINVLINISLKFYVNYDIKTAREKLQWIIMKMN